VHFQLPNLYTYNPLVRDRFLVSLFQMFIGLLFFSTQLMALLLTRIASTLQAMLDVGYC